MVRWAGALVDDLIIPVIITITEATALTVLENLMKMMLQKKFRKANPKRKLPDSRYEIKEPETKVSGSFY